MTKKKREAGTHQGVRPCSLGAVSDTSLSVMTKDEALEHLRNALRVKIPDPKRLVHDTEQKVLAEVVEELMRTKKELGES
jgi:hypothetical protein